MIVVFGGAFNPPTIAHYEIAKHILDLPFVEQLLFVPVGDHYEKVELISAFHRVKMLEILIKNLPGAKISNVEVEADRALKTIETLEYIHLSNPNSELAFVMGADNLYQFKKWYHHERLISKFKLLILNRGDSDVHTFIKDHFVTTSDHFIVINDFSKMDISSSAYRADTTRKDILLPDIEIYINENELYGD